MTLRDVKQRFFALRNGLLADMLRKQRIAPHKLIFGLNVPQLKEIAAEAGVDAPLAAALWADADCRESRLLAPMISPASADAFAMMAEVRSTEEADLLCHSLLRRCPGAVEAAQTALAHPDPTVRYCALRLLMNLMPACRKAAGAAIDCLPPHPLTDAVARQIRLELSYVDDL